MVAPRPRPHLSDRAAAIIKREKRRGAADKQLIQDPAVSITVRRRGDHDAGGWIVVGTYDLISISLTNRDPRETGQNQGAVETSTVGKFRAWVPIDCRQGDRFTWDFRDCVIDSVQPARSGVQDVQFHLLEGTGT